MVANAPNQADSSKRTNRKVRIVIADDHAVLRAGLQMLINAQADLEVVGEAGDSAEAVDQTAKLKPDVLILDITMPGMPAVKAVEQITSRYPGTRILVLTMHEDPAYTRSVLAAGASGYLVKRAADTELISAIRAVNRGRIFVDSTHLVDLLLGDSLSRNSLAQNKKNLLSDRETQVFQLLAQGYTNQEISKKIFVSVKTVETYRSRLTRKLGLRTRADLVRYALDIGLLTPGRTD